MSGIYATKALEYLGLGWSPLPLPAKRKTPPPDGFTGYGASMASGADVHTWVEDKPDANIGLRVPPTVLGIDVDAYDGKHGLETMLDAVQKYGDLPKTWVSTSRPGTVSGIRLYRVPAGRRWPSVLGKGVEIIRHEHRYLVAAPSLHPEGRTYVWLGPDGALSDAPNVDDLPDLPTSWVEGLDGGSSDQRGPKASLASGQAREWLDSLGGEPCRYIDRLIGEAAAALEVPDGRHDTMLAYVGKIVRAGDQGHSGVPTALDTVQSIFYKALGKGKTRTVDADPGEWQRAVDGAVAFVLAKPTAPENKGCCGETPAVTEFMASLANTYDAGDQNVNAGQSSPTGTSDDQTERQLDAAASFAREVAFEAHRIKVREAATRKVAQDRVGAAVRPAMVGLDDFLVVEDDDVAYRVERLWPTGGRVILAAQYKAGKSTLVGNVIRSLADGEPLLGQYATEQTTVALIDNELDERTLRRWLRDQGIVNRDRVKLVPLRGKVSSFDILDPETRAEWAAAVAGVDVVILDCLRPVLDALGLSEDKEAGRFLVAFDALLSQAGVSEAAVVHHMGHNGERSRGDSRILDWPDATWKLVREDAEDPGSVRYFSAFGRDVEVSESKLTFDADTRRLTIGGGSRKDSAADEVMEPLLELLEANPEGMSGRQVELALTNAGHRQASVRAALKRAQTNALTVQHQGEKRSIIHKINPSASSALQCVASALTHRGDECVSASISTTHTHHAPDAVKEEEEVPTHTLDSADRGKASAPKLVCRSCGLPMMVDDGTGTHPTCEVASS